MKVHAAAGRRSHALATYERCRRVLERELGVEPSRETDRVRDEVETAAAGPATAAPIALDLAFVGREIELDAISREWQAARSEPGHAVLIRGSIGVGKTRLVRRFAERGEPPPRTTWLTGHEAEVELSLAPALSLVGAWLETSASGGQVARLGAAAAALAHLLPAVRTVWPGTPELTGRPDEGQLLEALTLALLQMQGTGPALLVFDDLHWIDRGTAAWLGYALRRLPAGVLTIATVRDAEPPAPWVQALLADRRREGRLTEISLEPLSSAEVKRLVPEAPPELAGRLHETTRGNPLFLVEILRELDRRSGSGSELPLPPSVREAIRNRTAQLDESAREALVAVCVHGAGCSAGLVAEATGKPLEETLAHLDTLLDRRLLTPTEDGRGYTVDHPLIGRVVVDDLSPGRRQLWHRKLAAALRAESQPGISAQVLRHLLAGDGTTDEVIEAGMTAGDQALARHAYSEALDSFQVVRDRLGETGQRERHAIATERMGEALIGLGRWDDAIACYEQLLADTAEPLGRSRLRRRLAAALGDYGARGLERALELLAAAETDLAAAPESRESTVELARVIATSTVAHFHRSQFAAGLETAQRALALFAGRPGVERDVAEQIHLVAACQQRLGRLDEAEAGFRESLARVLALDDPLMQARYQDSLAILLTHRGRLREAAALEDLAVDTLGELGVPKVLAVVLGNRGYMRDFAGDLRGSRDAYLAAIEMARSIDSRFTIMHNQIGIADVLIRMGELDEARANLEAGIQLGRSIGTRQRLAHARIYMGDLALAEGDPAAAAAEIETGIAEGDPIGDLHVRRVGLASMARALIGLGDPQAAVAAARSGLEVAVTAGFVLDEGRNRIALGAALQAAGDPDANAELERAIAVLRPAQAGYLLAEALAQAGMGLRGRARGAALEEALALARAAGARPLAERVEAALN
jgi:tetratricopeptide (TPR) repeat protein